MIVSRRKTYLRHAEGELGRAEHSQRYPQAVRQPSSAGPRRCRHDGVAEVRWVRHHAQPYQPGHGGRVLNPPATPVAASQVLVDACALVRVFLIVQSGRQRLPALFTLHIGIVAVDCELVPARLDRGTPTGSASLPTMDSPQDDITGLALAAKAGDRDAASAFVKATQRDLHRFLTYLADPGEVEDLSQETYLRSMRALVHFDARSSARTWLFAIARNVAADHVRRAQRRPRLVTLDVVDEAADAVRQHRGPLLDDAIALRHLLRALDPPRREAFALTQVLGLSYGEAAQICDCPVGTIRSRVSRAREDLIAAIRNAHDDGRSRRTAT